MRFEWDEAKNRRNLAKHGIRFEIAMSAFDDPYALSIQDRVVEDEERWQTLGAIGGGFSVGGPHSWGRSRPRSDPYRLGSEGDAAGKESV